MDKWVETDARVIESRVRDLDVLGQPSADKSKSNSVYSDSVVRITWTDQQGGIHYGEFQAPEESPQFQLIEGDTIQINYDSSAPEDFKIRGLALDQTRDAAKRTFFAVAVFLVCAAAVILYFVPELLVIFSKN